MFDHMPQCDRFILTPPAVSCLDEDSESLADSVVSRRLSKCNVSIGLSDTPAVDLCEFLKTDAMLAKTTEANSLAEIQNHSPKLSAFESMYTFPRVSDAPTADTQSCTPAKEAPKLNLADKVTDLV